MGNTTPTATSFVPALWPLAQPGSTRVRMRRSKGLAEREFHFRRLCFGQFPKQFPPRRNGAENTPISASQMFDGDGMLYQSPKSVNWSGRPLIFLWNPE